ncbi:MAG: diaminopimelate epimerase [Planctomycetes bacterium]|nr:diaminopimelate epimerase [Planctomycetota bacterium]
MTRIVEFTKMQGIGNDYVYIDCLETRIDDPSALSVRVSDRHFGVGSDGLILLETSAIADFRMRMFNADGSEAQMCGNGIRCLAKLIFDKGLTSRTEFSIETPAGVKAIKVAAKDEKVFEATIEMGKATWDGLRIPTTIDKNEIIDEPLSACGREFRVSCVSVGNPHAAIFVDKADEIPIEVFGPLIERNPLFPERINVHFVEIAGKDHLKMRTWERGSGITLACGTGATAVAFIAHRKGIAGREVRTSLPGGDLRISIRPDEVALMTGPAVTVFTGTIEV